MKRYCLGCLLIGVLIPAAHGQVVVNDDFQSYTDTTDMQNTWVPFAAGAEANYVLGDQNSYFINPQAPPDGPFDTGDQAAWHIGGQVAAWQSAGGNELNDIQPSATKKVVFEYDIWDEQDSANKRMTMGLRQLAGLANFFELGVYNAAPLPFYGIRMLGFPGAVLPAEQVGGWFGFTNLVDDSGTPIDPPLTGSNSSVQGWHTLRAEFEPNQAVITLDLNRDGNINSTMVIPYDGFNVAGGFQQLRFGGPSGISSAGGGMIFDNVYLALEDFTPSGLAGDYNEDGKVDAADYVLWRKDPASYGGDPAGYDAWVANFGAMNPGSGSGLGASAVPEPATLALVLLSVVALGVGRRSR